MVSADFYKEEVDNAIEAIAILKENPSTLTPDEHLTLLAFPSAGVLKEAGVFSDQNKPRWLVQKRERLKALLTAEEWASLQNAGMFNSHYTKSIITRQIWDFVAQYLKPGDKVLDPGCGTGNFFKWCPPDINYVGVDNEIIASAIARKLYPKASIFHKDFMEWKYPGKFQAVIGNVPFVNGNKTYELEGKKLVLELHAQFFIKAVSHLEEGGVLAMLTSTNTLDSYGQDYIAFRGWLNRQCHFLGAIRLPAEAVYYGDTKVTTDLILLRKRKVGDNTPNPVWTHTTGSGMMQKFTTSPQEIQISRWFHHHPEYLLGEIGYDPLTQGKRMALFQRTGQIVCNELQAALKKLSTVKKEETTMAINNQSWEAFQVKFVDSKGKEPGDAAVQIHFPAKPPEKVIKKLGKEEGMGFIFHGNGISYWWAYLNAPVPKKFVDQGVESVEQFVRGLVKAYAGQGAAIAQEKPKTEKPTGGLAAMMQLMREMSQELKSLRSEVAELKESAGNSAEIEALKAENAQLKAENAKLTTEVAALKKGLKDVAETAARSLEEKDAALAQLETKYKSLVSSIEETGFTLEELLGDAPADDAPAISFDDDEPSTVGSENDSEDADTSTTGAADDSVGFDMDDLEGLEEESEEGFDPEMLDSLGK